MKYVIQNNVPRCPKCSAYMDSLLHDSHRYFMCNDCYALYQVIGTGKAECEVIATDNGKEFVKE